MSPVEHLVASHLHPAQRLNMYSLWPLPCSLWLIAFSHSGLIDHLIFFFSLSSFSAQQRSLVGFKSLSLIFIPESVREMLLPSGTQFHSWRI